MKELNKKLDNENGSALVIVMMVLVVVSALGGALGMVTINSHNLAEHTQDTNSAYYIAEAGANIAYEEFKTHVLSAYETHGTKGDFDRKVEEAREDIDNTIYGESYFPSNDSDKIEAVIEIIKLEDEESTHVIRSTGKVDGKTRTVEKDIKVTWENKSTGQFPMFPDNKFMIIKNNITFRNGNIEGDIFIDSDKKEIIELGWGTNLTHNREFGYTIYTKHLNFSRQDIFKTPSEELSKHISVNPEYTKDMIDWGYYDNFKPNLPDTGTYYNIITDEYAWNVIEIGLNGHSKKDHFKHSGNNSITIKGDTYLVVNKISSDYGVTNIKGNGKLTIIVHEDMSIAGGFNMDNNVELEIIYLNDNKELQIVGGEGLVWGNIIAPYSKVLVNGSAEVHGNIISKSIRVTGQGKVFGNIYTEKAEFSGSGHLLGSIIAEDIIIDNAGGTIKLRDGNTGGTPGDGEATPGDISDIISSNPATEN